MRMPESKTLCCRLFELARDYFGHVVPDSKVRMKSVAMNGMEVFKCASISFDLKFEGKFPLPPFYERI